MIIGQLAGVKIKINPLFFILLIIAAITAQFKLISIFFALLLAHEIGHVLMAVKLDLAAYELEIMPLGGRLRLASGKEIEPDNEIKLAIAGPIINIMLLSIFLFLRNFITISENDIVNLFIKGNITLALFNLLPVLPLDGGRIYRALLSRSKGYIKATNYILFVSLLFIIVLIILAVVGIIYGFASWSLLCIAIFLFCSLVVEFRNYRLYFMKHYLTEFNTKNNRVWRTHNLTANNNTVAKDVVKKFMPGKFNIVTVINDNGAVVDRITETQIMQAIYTKGPLVKLESIRKV